MYYIESPRLKVSQQILKNRFFKIKKYAHGYGLGDWFTNSCTIRSGLLSELETFSFKTDTAGLVEEKHLITALNYPLKPSRLQESLEGRIMTTRRKGFCVPSIDASSCMVNLFWVLVLELFNSSKLQSFL